MTSKTPSDKIAVIAIDEQSISNIGRWPWPREVQALLIDKLAASKAKVIGNTVFFFEPQRDPGLAYVDRMIEAYNKAYRGAVTPAMPGLPPIGAPNPAPQVPPPPTHDTEIGDIRTHASPPWHSAT